MPPAARIGDMHTCPMVTPGTPPIPHVGGPVCVGCPTVLIGFMPAARIGDMAVCVGPPDVIAKGSPTVMIGGMPTARLGDLTVHGGVITIGCPTVLIGEVGVGGAGGASPPSGGQGALVGAQAGKAAGHSGSKDTVLAGVKIGKGILAVKDAYNLGVIAGRMLNALSAASKFGQKLLPAAGKAMSRGSKALGPIGIVIGIGLSASEGALEAKPGKRLKGAAKEVGKDVAVMAGGAAVGAAIGAMVGSAAGGVGAVPGAIAGAKIGAAVASVGSAIYDAFNEE